MMKRKKKQILSYLPFLVIPKVQKEPGEHWHKGENSFCWCFLLKIQDDFWI